MSKKRSKPEKDYATDDLFSTVPQSATSNGDKTDNPSVRVSRNTPDPDMKKLWAKANGRCAHPDCRGKGLLLLEPTPEGDSIAVIGEMAHIIAHSKEGPRGDPNFPESERKRYPNLILLCPNHHILVDKQPKMVSADTLRGWKAEWERTVEQQIAKSVPLVPPAELKLITDYLIQQFVPSMNIDSGDNSLPTPPAEKIRKNELSDEIRSAIGHSLMRRRDVHDFIVHQAKMIPNYPEKLREGFLIEYNRLRSSGFRGDDLYYALRDYASQNSRDQLRIAAAGIVLAYYFEICEVFER
jgi:hypothetical protein